MGRRVEQLPPDRLARLDIVNLAAFLGLDDTTVRRAVTWHSPIDGTLHLPGVAPIPVQRSAENGVAFIWRRHLDRAVDDAYRAGRLPELEQEARA